MPQATYHFPEGFLWGAATAAHQAEGGNTNNNWWAWEQEPGRIIHGQSSGLACDWWGGRWKEDFDRAKETGQNAHRLSIEWSRVQPHPDRWDEDALDHYRQMLQGLQERGMTPMVTLHHFTDPLWLVEMGGWEKEGVVALFNRYVDKTVEALKEYCDLWVTINEPNVYVTSGYFTGDFPPGKQGDLNTAFLVTKHMVMAHAAAYETIHRLQRDAQVGFALNYRSFAPARPYWPLDRLAAGLLHGTFNMAFPNALLFGNLRMLHMSAKIPQAMGTQDYLGINYYTREMVRFAPFKASDLFNERYYRAEAELSDTGFIANEPDGFWEALSWGKKTGLPIFITENGIEDADDHLRPAYLTEHIHQMWRAVNFNWPVKGYFYWTLVDNFEWERAWTQRFGLWELDTETQARRKRPSADLYASICEENAITYDAVLKYAPSVLEKLYP